MSVDEQSMVCVILRIVSSLPGGECFLNSCHFTLSQHPLQFWDLEDSFCAGEKKKKHNPKYLTRPLVPKINAILQAGATFSWELLSLRVYKVGWSLCRKDLKVLEEGQQSIFLWLRQLWRIEWSLITSFSRPRAPRCIFVFFCFFKFPAARCGL